MVFRVQTRQWAKLPAAPLDIYVQSLNYALLNVIDFKFPQEVLDAMGFTDESDITAEDLQAVVKKSMIEWQIVQYAVAQLEEMKPAPPELLELHVRAVGYLRGFLTYTDRCNAQTFAQIAGQEREARKYRKEAEDWLKSLLDVHNKFAQELRQVRQKQPLLYSTLGRALNENLRTLDLI